jgi:hypothetical protein
VSAILIALIGFRRVLAPVGFSTNAHTNNLIFRDVIDQLQLIIDTDPGNIPLRSLRSQLERLVYSGVADAIDWRYISAQIASVIIPDCFDDGFIIGPPSDTSGVWDVPGDVPLSNVTQIIQQLLLFPPTS